MSKQERWIVYPLLFLAIGMAYRDTVMPSRRSKFEADLIQVKYLRCEELQLTEPLVLKKGLEIRGEDGRVAVLIGHDGKTTSGPGGKMIIFGNEGQPRIALGAADEGKEGRIEIQSWHGNKRTTLDNVSGLINDIPLTPSTKTPGEKASSSPGEK